MSLPVGRPAFIKSNSMYLPSESFRRPIQTYEDPLPTPTAGTPAAAACHAARISSYVEPSELDDALRLRAMSLDSIDENNDAEPIPQTGYHSLGDHEHRRASAGSATSAYHHLPRLVSNRGQSNVAVDTGGYSHISRSLSATASESYPTQPSSYNRLYDTRNTAPESRPRTTSAPTFSHRSNATHPSACSPITRRKAPAFGTVKPCWYHGPITRPSAEHLLVTHAQQNSNVIFGRSPNSPKGLFLVREKHHDQAYVISVLLTCGGAVLDHHTGTFTPGGAYAIQHHLLERSRRSNGQPGSHWILNDQLRFNNCFTIEDVVNHIRDTQAGGSVLFHLDCPCPVPNGPYSVPKS